MIWGYLHVRKHAKFLPLSAVWWFQNAGKALWSWYIYIWPVCFFFSRTLKFQCDKDSDFVKILHTETLTFYATIMAFTEGGTRSSWAFYRQKYFVLEAKPHILKENITAIFFWIRHRWVCWRKSMKCSFCSSRRKLQIQTATELLK